MSGCAVGHALIAVGSKQPEVVLADMVSGAFTHTLDGHTWVHAQGHARVRPVCFSCSWAVVGESRRMP